jgi:hypothetical protein
VIYLTLETLGGSLWLAPREVTYGSQGEYRCDCAN